MSSFTFSPAVRDRVSLLISIAGVSGAGKTLSALLLARGLAGGDDSKIAVIDTEAGRARHYAPAPGQEPGPFTFGFNYAELRPPFTPERYIEIIKAADDAGHSVIMVDSTSHIWDGEGGVQEMHDNLLGEQVEAARKSHRGNWEFDEDKARERLSIGAWKTPKAEHKRFVSRLLQTRAHLILCLRADEKMRMEKVTDDNGRSRTVITQAKDLPPAERWVPICEKRLPYEMTLSFLLTPDRPGFPIPLKLQEQHRFAIPLDKPLGEATGRALASWAGGSTTQSKSAVDNSAHADVVGEDILDAARAAANRGKAAFTEFWKTLPRDQRVVVNEIMEELQGLTKRADDKLAEQAEKQAADANASAPTPTGEKTESQKFRDDADELVNLLERLDHAPKGIDQDDVDQVRAYLRGMHDAEEGISRKVVPDEFKGKAEAVAWGLGHDHITKDL